MSTHVSDNHVVIAYNTCWYVYNFRLPLIRALMERGWRVTVLAPGDAYTERVVEAGAEHRHIQLDAKGTNPFRELATIRRFKAAYHSLKPAVALQYTIKPDIYGSIAARSLGIPVINTITGLGSMFSGGLREVLARWLYRFAFSRADLVLFQNGDDRALFLDGRMVLAGPLRPPARIRCRHRTLCSTSARRRPIHVPPRRPAPEGQGHRGFH